jgi:hypothetical protein
MDMWNKVYPYIERFVWEKPTLRWFVQEFKMAPPTALVDMGNTVNYLLLNKSDKKIFEPEDIKNCSETFKQILVSRRE